MPISEDRMEDLNDAQEKVGDQAVIRVMVDHSEQIQALGRFSERCSRRQKWSMFVKVDGGGRYVQYLWRRVSVSPQCLD